MREGKSSCARRGFVKVYLDDFVTLLISPFLTVHKHYCKHLAIVVSAFEIIMDNILLLVYVY